MPIMDAENQTPLSKLSSRTKEIDAEIEENANYSLCIRKEVEVLKNETERMKAASAEKQDFIKVLETQLEELASCLSIQRASLSASEQSVLQMRTLKEVRTREANDYTRKYAEIVAMFEDELQEYRSIYVDASDSYKDFRVQEIELKKLNVKKMILDKRLEDMELSQRQFKTIQWKRLQNSIIEFAEIYVLQLRNQRTSLKVKKLKEEEQMLLRENRRLSEAVKQKQKVHKTEQTKAKPLSTFEGRESSLEEFRNFLNQGFRPVTLTHPSTSRTLNFNQDCSKVKVLDMQIVKAPPAKFESITLKKKIEKIIKSSMEDAKRGSLLGSQRRKNDSQSSQKSTNLSGSQKTELQGSQKSTIGAQKVDKGVPKLENLDTLPFKPPSQSAEEKNAMEVDEKVSKFFNAKRKCVTFHCDQQNQISQEVNKIQIVSAKDKENVEPVKERNIFQKPFLPLNDLPKSGEKMSIFDKNEQILTDKTLEGELETGDSMAVDGPTSSPYDSLPFKRSGDFSINIRDPSSHRFSFAVPSPPQNVAEKEDEPTDSGGFNLFNFNFNNNPFSLF